MLISIISLSFILSLLIATFIFLCGNIRKIEFFIIFGFSFIISFSFLFWSIAINTDYTKIYCENKNGIIRIKIDEVQGDPVKEIKIEHKLKTEQK